MVLPYAIAGTRHRTSPDQEEEQAIEQLQDIRLRVLHHGDAFQISAAPDRLPCRI
ncbi:hypothetical protein [Roseomonas populi]|uniref:Uncharacterized protein n=1 Tax=Roseomonas populi TaxID=3121582 RepID=A0ABT1WZ02_9PROT|nr:hypothetical protein [Roseomonas pecuniae]MCR0981080.1 hypothetical protein [Roseomonas pecuniae]